MHVYVMRWEEIDKTSLNPLFESNDILLNFFLLSFSFSKYIYHLGSNDIQNDWLLHLRLLPLPSPIWPDVFLFFSIYSRSFGNSFFTDHLYYYYQYASHVEIHSVISNSVERNKISRSMCHFIELQAITCNEENLFSDWNLH